MAKGGPGARQVAVTGHGRRRTRGSDVGYFEKKINMVTEYEYANMCESE